VLLLLAAGGVIVSATATASTGGSSEFIVIGDSIAAGAGVQPEQAWPEILAGQAGYKLADLARGGSSSHSVTEGVFNWPSGRSQSHLAEAKALLAEAEPGSVAAVALGIGVNDWIWTRDPNTGRPCGWEPGPGCDAVLRSAMNSLDDNLHLILTDLRAAMEPSTPLLIMTYYDIGNREAIEMMNDVILEEIAEHNASHVDVQAYFSGREQELIVDGVHPSIAGHALLANIFSNALPPDSDGDGLSDIMEHVLGADPTLVDTDNDGCSDGQEFGHLEAAGGRRDPVNPWDFYDVPDAGNGRDGKISLSVEILSVAFRLGATDEGATATINRYTDPLSAPPPDQTAYHPAFDRSPAPRGAELWSLGPPDGQIDLMDLLGVIWQYGHEC